MMGKLTAYHGTVVHCTKEKPWNVLKDATIVVQNGKIINLYCGENSESIKNKLHIEDTDFHVLKEKEFLMPGLIDTHIHASQYVNCGTALDLPLLEWLEKYTFPTEAKFKDLEFATLAYQKAVLRTLKNGTTCACYYATIHKDASIKLAEIIDRMGQRAFVGKVNMNQNSPDYYIEETEKSAEDTVNFVDEILSMKSSLVTPIVTPRFAPSTDMQLMKKLGIIAKKYNIPVQTHLSENLSECSWVKSLYPECSSYTDVYEEAGLLGNRTVLAHAIHLDDEEIELMKQRGAGISHCPNSNISLASGHCDVRRLLKAGVKVGLGTDCSGGYHPSILDSIRHASATSKLLKIESKNPNYKLLNHRDLLYLATVGGSEVLGLDDKIGSFEVGKEFDALRINPCVTDSPFDLFDKDDTEDIIQKFIYLGDDRNITQVFVSGECVVQRDEL